MVRDLVRRLHKRGTQMVKRVAFALVGLALVVLALGVGSRAAPSLSAAVEPALPAVSVYQSYYGVYFVNGKQGWVVGTYGNILHTEDGGSTWVHQASATDQPLFSVQFVDPEHGWALGK